MKFSEAWVREWVNPPITTEALLAQLTGAGLEVDSARPASDGIDGVVVARVTAVERHPNADRLRLCEVDAGDGGRLSVVCGAPNVYAGMYAPLARIGVRLPGGVKIRRSRIRGVESQGMLCSAVELGLGEESDGILDLGDEARPGVSVVEHLRLDDTCIDIELTPNRGDCLGIEGIAREVALLNRLPFVRHDCAAVAASLDATFAVRLETPQDCPRYAGRVIRDIDPAARTPLWMQERLRRCGVRSISPVVDVSNYVMLELGQPMHAFDLDRLNGGIVVRRARRGETLTLLDGQTVTLDDEALVIADDNASVALAGVMGGAETAVCASTRNIFLESAWFLPKTVALGARRLGLHTDASHRFERSVSPEMQRRAVERATRLLLDIVGGSAGPVVDTVVADAMPRRAPITLREERITRLLGVTIAAVDVRDILERVGARVEALDAGWRVTPPAFRADITIEVDLIEELARVTGYDNLPARTPEAPLVMRRDNEARVTLACMRSTLVGRDYQEAITYSFVDPRIQELLAPEAPALALANPISPELAVMRTTLWPGLIGAMLHNLKRQQTRARLFESGLVFRGCEGTLEQVTMLGGVVTGSRVPRQWSVDDEAIDFFDLKADVAALIALTGCSDDFRFVAGSHPALHPGQAARVERDGALVGWIGALHPRAAQELKIGAPTFLFELATIPLGDGRLPRCELLSPFPTVRRDIAVVVDESVSARGLRDCVGQAGVNVLKKLELFDVYRGEGIDSGKKSIALSLVFEDRSKTLNDREADAGVNTIVACLKDKLGAELRG